MRSPRHGANALALARRRRRERRQRQVLAVERELAKMSMGRQDGRADAGAEMTLHELSDLAPNMCPPAARTRARDRAHADARRHAHALTRAHTYAHTRTLAHSGYRASPQRPLGFRDFAPID